MKRLIAGAVVAGVAVFAGVGAFQDDTVRDSTGAIVESGGLGAFVIEIGDCLNIPDGDLVQSVEGLPCSQATARRTAGVSAAFILINSAAALTGLIASHGAPPIDPAATGIFVVAVLGGGFIGTSFGTKRLGHIGLRRMLAVVLITAGLKMILIS